MDIQTVITIAVAASPVIATVLEAARRVSFVPFDPKSPATMRLAVAFVSALGGVALAYFDHTLSADLVKGAAEALLSAAVIYAGAVTTHDHALKQGD